MCCELLQPKVKLVTILKQLEMLPVRMGVILIIISFLHTHTAGVLTRLCNSIGALLISRSALTPSSSSEGREESLLAHLLLRCDG